MIELQSETFSVGNVTYDSIQDALYRLFCLHLINPTHIFLCQEEYDALTKMLCTRTCFHIIGSRIVTEQHVSLQKVSHVVNMTTARAMKLDVSPKLTQGTFSVLWKSEAVS